MDTKTKILRSALNAASETGLEAVTMDEIAKRSEIRKPSIYHYYRHRESLLRAMLEKYAPGRDFALSIDFRRPTEELLLELLGGYVEQCAKGEGRKIFRVIEGSHLYSEDAAKVYAAEGERRLKAITAFLKKLEERKVVVFSPFETACRFYSDFAHALIVRVLSGEKIGKSEAEGFVSAFCRAFLEKGKERK